MKENVRVIPKKNYVILGLVIVFTLFLLYYFYMWFNAYNDSKVNRPILNKYMDVINYNELNDYIVENPNCMVYVSVLEDTRIREFEKEFKNKFKSGEIKQELLYLDLTDEKKNSSVKKEITSKYAINSLNITNVPCIMIIKDGEVVAIYSISDNDYDVDRLVSFINDNVLGEIE